MSAIIETLIVCDGGPKCPMDGPFGEGDGRGLTAAEQRRNARDAGWVCWHGRDYCPQCAARLGIRLRKSAPS